MGPLEVAIYGFMAGDGPVLTSNLGLDRVILRGVAGDNPCGGNSTLPPTPTPAPTSPMTEPSPGPTEPPTRSPTTPPYDFVCPTQYGLYEDAADCHYFYQCSNWTPYRMVCPSSLVYNPNTERCDYSTNVPGC
ncbi:Endochitinase [Amphibalanus amphitrite]|uniref:Endochitinase n=1 Tax=Amphibalanus amphitrite TaxID=1232801 RepID=A0A6A4W1U1_AMPAM|nr:Endochitinase [Amphibalanus amphitrite]KAF0299209.1 Endochitinase [Amphibalanus amphitrite]